MTKTTFARLGRKQLDRQLRALAPFREVQQPAHGWIRAVRNALGMSAEQLARRTNVSKQSIGESEAREVAGTITVARLRTIAEALDCRLVVAFVPNTTLEETVQRQAQRKATEHRNRVVHTMRLEAQQDGVEDALSSDADDWTSFRPSALWD